MVHGRDCRSKRSLDLTQRFIFPVAPTAAMSWDTWLFRASLVWLLALVAGMLLLLFFE
jgi:hypothetical protein